MKSMKMMSNIGMGLLVTICIVFGSSNPVQAVSTKSYSDPELKVSFRYPTTWSFVNLNNGPLIMPPITENSGFSVDIHTLNDTNWFTYTQYKQLESSLRKGWSSMLKKYKTLYYAVYDTGTAYKKILSYKAQTYKKRNYTAVLITANRQESGTLFREQILLITKDKKTVYQFIGRLDASYNDDTQDIYGKQFRTLLKSIAINKPTVFPVISRIEVQQFSRGFAEVDWRSNSSASSGTLLYGLTKQLENKGNSGIMTLDPTSRAVAFTATNNTTYYYRIRECAPSGECTQSPRWNFTTSF